MPWAYFDASALVKRYVDEAGRRDVLRLLRRYDVVTSAIVPVELTNAVRRRAADGSIAAERVPVLLERIAAERELWALVDVSRPVLAAAEALVAGHTLRSLDAIHVASAQAFGRWIDLSALAFISSDARQTTVAAAIGMTATLINA
jgi:predicted nucleic acid-binding protein